MKYFLETSDTIQEGLGFSHFDSLHIAWLLVFAAVTIMCCFLYCKLGENSRKKMRYVVASLCVLDEWYMVVCLLIGGNYTKPGNPLYIFKQLFGSHLIGFPIIISAVVLVMYLPVILLKKRKGVHNEAK
ncbi:MAG: hypothetical protein IKL38_00645 [Firmicutes bacterium]|nr:hypothetical protein [Bacillota bacterium]